MDDMNEFVVVDIGYRRMLFRFPPHLHGVRDAARYVKDL